MSIAKITMIGYENYLNYHNKSLFDFLELPLGVDKEAVANNILLRGGEFECLYGDADFMREAVGIFSKKWSGTFNKWYKALNIEYNPLENYDRIEEWTDGTHTNDSQNVNSSSNSSNTGEVSAYDSSSFQPNERQSGNASNSASTTAETNANSVHTGRTHGNIGVTSSQQLLQSEMVVAKLNLFEQIADTFLAEFCIMVYT